MSVRETQHTHNLVMFLDIKIFDLDVFGSPNQIEDFKASGSGKTQPAGRVVAGAAWENGPPRDTVAALEQVAAAACRVGAQSASALAEEAKAARSGAMAAKPVHLRLGRMKQRHEEAAAKEEQTKVAADQAQTRHRQAAAHTQRMQEELAAVEAEVAKAPAAAGGTSAEQALRTGVQALLDALERSNLSCTAPFAEPARGYASFSFFERASSSYNSFINP